MRIYAAAVAAVGPHRVMSRALAGGLTISAGETGNTEANGKGDARAGTVAAGTAAAGAGDVSVDVGSLIDRAAGVRLLAVGKAAIGMAAAAEQRLGDRMIEGFAIAPASVAARADASALRSRAIGAAHPLPDATSVAAALAALDLAARARSGELLLVALSGGASSLIAAPVSAITLADKIAVTAALMRGAATIRELNIVRKHLSAIKGGRLLAATGAGVDVLTLILSDVPGNDLATIGSGPTVADPTTYNDAIGVLKRRGAWGRAPEAVRDHLERGAAGEFSETLKPGAAVLARVTNLIVGDNRMAVDAAAEAAQALGYGVERGRELGGEANELGRTVARRVSEIRAERVCLVAGGEPVVSVKGGGRGGRAQQCALAMAIELASLGARRENVGRAMALFAGTDGIDGPTDAAGAIATSETFARAAEAGVDPQAALDRNDAYEFFKSLGDLVIIGPTGTNVADIMVALVHY
jgi:hydroxypyruvate reductase